MLIGGILGGGGAEAVLTGKAVFKMQGTQTDIRKAINTYRFNLAKTQR